MVSLKILLLFLLQQEGGPGKKTQRMETTSRLRRLLGTEGAVERFP